MGKWLIFLSVTMATAASATTYMWTDESGQVHYSDRPHPGATVIELRPAQGYASSSSRAEATQEPSVADSGTQTAYERIEVLSPQAQETLWNIEGGLPVQVQLEPALRPGHHFGVYLDGQLVDVNTTSSQFTVPEVWRGVHSLQAVVLDSTGSEVVRSLAVVFQVQQTSLLNPNNPNSPANNPSAPRAAVPPVSRP
jgi:hypothetical protein